MAGRQQKTRFVPPGIWTVIALGAPLLLLASQPALATTFISHLIDNTVADGPGSVFAIDLDGDSDIDALSAAAQGMVVWYENDGSENFTAHTIAVDALNGKAVYAIDVDGDTDIDVLSASFSDDKIAWYENDGSENFTTHVITTAAQGAQSVFAVDLDGDSDTDVLSASTTESKIAWYENDGSENFTTHVISLGASSAISVYAVDVDGDTDIDVLSASSGDNKIAWYENDGSENFTEHVITTAALLPQQVHAADVDGDTDMDVLSASAQDNKIAWYENDGSENFTEHVITTDAVVAQSVHAVDLDADLDMDVLSASSADNKVAWYENDGSENFTARTITTATVGAGSVHAADIDGDSKLDVVSASYSDDTINWYENFDGDPSTISLHPTGDGTTVEFTPSGAPNAWDCANDQAGNAGSGPVVPYDPGTYLDGADGQRVMLTLDGGLVPAGSTITGITVRAQVYRGSGPGAALRLSYQRMPGASTPDGSPIDGPSFDLTTACCTEIATTWSTENWTTDDLDNLEIGAFHNGGNSSAYITQMYVLIDYITVDVVSSISGTVFEDADFAGVSSAYDGGANDLALANVDVELYDGADAYIASTVTAGDGSFSFLIPADGNYKVRVRSATIGDSDTPPAGGLNATVPGTWPYPLAEMVWGHGAELYGGQDATVDDTDIGDNTSPGDSYVAVAVSGAAVTGVNLGFTYNLIVNTLDDGNADNLRSDQGSLRQFLKNANAIDAAGGTNANSSEFHMQEATNQSSGADTWWRISPTTPLPVLEDSATVVNGATQTANGGDNNSRGPEIEIDGASIPTAAGLTVTSADVWIHGIVLNGFTTAPGMGILVDGASAIGNRITGCYIGTNAVGDAELPNFYGITLSNGTSGTIIGEAGEGNVISGSNFYGIEFDNAGANTTIQGNRIGTNAMGDGVFANAQGLYIDGGSAIVIGGPGAGEGNLISGSILYGINLQVATDVTIQGNWMGLNQAGTDPLPDGGTAIFGGGASNDVTIGGPAPGEGNIIAGNDGNGIAFQQGCHNWVIQGNTIGTGPLGTETNLGNTGAANLRVTTNDITINAKIGGDNPGEGNLIAFASGPGIDCASLGSAVEITGNVIRDNGEEGITARVDSLTVAGNEIYNNGAGFDGILIQDVASDGKVYHNTIHGSGGDGIEIVGLGHEIRNNIVTGSTGYGINLNGGSMAESNNLVTGTATIQANVLGRSNVALDGSDLDADPSYIDAAGGDFSLTECSSPAINAGLDLGVDQPDMNGIDPGNYNGSVPDMGALETSCVAGSYAISGTVFEDVNYGGGAGVDHAAALARAGPFTVECAGVTVELYDSGGNHVSAVSPQTTDAAGNYGFTGLAPASYTVRVVNSSVTSTRAGSDGSELGVQTYRIDGDGEPIGTGASKVGGEVPADEDAAANSGAQTLAALQGTDLDTDAITEWTQSIVTVDASGGNVTGVDFGFNFDTIVNTNDKDQGSLRQFILNANLLTDQASLAQNGLTAGAETSIFMIPSGTDPLGRPVDTGFDAGRGVAVIAPVSEMEALVDSGTFLDATTQTANVGDTNPGILGYAGPVGLGADGVIATGDEPTLSGVAAPEVEFKGNSTLEFGLRLQGNDITLRGFAVYGFGISGLDANILVGHHSLETNNTNCRIEANVLGTMADNFVDPGPGVRSPTINIYVRTADQGAIVGNLLGYVGRENVRILSTALNWQVTDNEIRAGGRETTFGGVTYIADATGELKRNLIADDNATAVLGINTDLLIEDNTITGNLNGAIGFFDNSGSRVTTASVLQNDLTGNGSGVVVLGENGASPAITEIRISRNRFGGNTWNAIDLAPDWTADGVSVNDGTELGDSSVPNSCGTVLTTGNIGLDTPLIDSAVLSAGTTTIIGRACPGAEIEIYRAVADGDASDTAGGTDYGEGVEYLDTATADVAGDWTIMTAALAEDNHVSAIAIDDSGNTSEFGPNLVVTAIGLSGTVFEDADFAGTATDYDGGVADLPLVNVDVELYNGTTDAYMASTTTTTGGIFTFGTLADGIYKVRVRSATIGDADTPPAGGLHPTVPAAWPYPLAEMTWGDGVALIGGQDPDVDDTATGDNAGPGDTWVAVTISGGDVSEVNLGFSYELIVNTADDANADNVRSNQGCLRQFIKNSNAIVGINKSWFQIPSS